MVNQALLALFVEAFGVQYLAGAFLATQGSTTWNFVGTEWWAFRGRHSRVSLPTRAVLFFAMNNLALLLVRVPVLWGLTSGLGVHYLLSNLVSLIVVVVVRFSLADRVIWRPAPAGNRSEIRSPAS